MKEKKNNATSRHGKSIKNDAWISDEDKLNPDVLPDLPGYHILVDLFLLKKKLKVVYYYQTLPEMIWLILLQ